MIQNRLLLFFFVSYFFVRNIILYIFTTITTKQYQQKETNIWNFLYIQIDEGDEKEKKNYE